MSIISGILKYKDYIKTTASTYQLSSRWTSANTLEFDDGKTAQSKLGAIDGISSSKTANSTRVAASTALTNELYSNLASGQIQFLIQNGKGFYKAVGADTWLPFKSGTPIIATLNEYKWPDQHGQRDYFWIPAYMDTTYLETVSSIPSDGIKVKQNITLKFNCICGIPHEQGNGNIIITKNDQEIYKVSAAGSYYDLFTRLKNYSEQIQFISGDVIKIKTSTNIYVTNGGILPYCLILIA